MHELHRSRFLHGSVDDSIPCSLPLSRNCVVSLQINFLKAVAGGETKMTSTRVMSEFRLGTPRNVSKNRSILIRSDIISENDGKYYFVDPGI
jgi:hypothetical protein